MGDYPTGISRKKFLKNLGLAGAAVLGAPVAASRIGGNVYELNRPNLAGASVPSPNSTLQIALIGAGMMGQGNGRAVTEHSGAKIVAACDLYDSRLERCKELFGEDITLTRDYRELLRRDDIDAVVISSTDHWHEKQAIDALAAGKAVYLEKPMVRFAEEGHRVIEAEKRYGKPLIIGSQRTSSIIYEKAAELYQNGEIGNINFVEGYWDRFSAIGAWQYSIPPSASPENIDWDTYLKNLPGRAFDPELFFRWRNFSEFGTGIPGDLFVHLFSGLHMITGSYGPERIMATGGLRYWKDGRDAEDVVFGLYDYPETEAHPEFTLSLRVNFADGSGGGSRIRMIGDAGEMEIGWNHVTVRKADMPSRPGMSIRNFSEPVQDEYRAYYNERYPETRPEMIAPREFVYRAPEGYSDRHDHFGFWFDAIRNGTGLLQDGMFGLRACGPALLTNDSLRKREAVHWNPEEMTTT